MVNESNLLKTLLEQEIFSPYEPLKDIFSDHQEFDPDYNYYNTITLNCNYFLEEDYLDQKVKQNLQLICINIRSAVKNLIQLTTMLADVFDFCPIIALTETWFNLFNSNLYQIRGYDGFHTIRTNNKRGGGVSVFIKQSYMAVPITELNTTKPCIETVFVRIQTKPLLNNRGIVIGCIYRPPHSDQVSFIEEFTAICEALKDRNEDVYICGDINLNLLSANQNAHIANFINTVLSFEYVPLINKPTRLTGTGSSATLIDNIFVRNMHNNYEGGIVITDISDHFLIFCVLQSEVPQKADSFSLKRNFSNNNRNLFKRMIANINWSDIYDCVDTQSAYHYLHATIRSNFDKCFPKETYKNTYKDRLPWLTNELKQQIKKKNRLYVHSKRNPTQLNIEKYKNVKRALNKNLSMTKRQYYNELLDENKLKKL